VRADWQPSIPSKLTALVRAHGKAADFVEDLANREEVCRILVRAEPDQRRGGGDPPHARRPSQGRARRHHALQAIAI